MIVHNINLAFDAFCRPLERMQALFEIKLYVVIDYYYRQFQYIKLFYASSFISDRQRSMVGMTKNRHRKRIMPIYPKATFINT